RPRRLHDGSSALFCMEPIDLRPGVSPRVALIDSLGNIVAVNKHWMALAEATATAMDRIGPGGNYLEGCQQASGSSADSRKALAGIQRVLKSEVPFFSMDYTSHVSGGLAHFRMIATRVDYKDAQVLIAHTDITDLQRSKEEDYERLQQFARRLISAQEGERQRSGGEIHDDIGNRMALMSLSIRQLIKDRWKSPSASARDLDKILHGIPDLSIALRNLSHWLHPPSLRYLGVGAAL